MDELEKVRIAIEQFLTMDLMGLKQGEAIVSQRNDPDGLTELGISHLDRFHETG